MAAQLPIILWLIAILLLAKKKEVGFAHLSWFANLGSQQTTSIDFCEWWTFHNCSIGKKLAKSPEKNARFSRFGNLKDPQRPFSSLKCDLVVQFGGQVHHSLDQEYDGPWIHVSWDYIYIYVCVDINNTYIYTYVFILYLCNMCLCLYVFIYVYICFIFVYVCLYMFIFDYICLYLFIYVYICLLFIYVYICLYTYIYIQRKMHVRTGYIHGNREIEWCICGRAAMPIPKTSTHGIFDGKSIGWELEVALWLRKPMETSTYFMLFHRAWTNIASRSLQFDNL